MLVSCSSCNSKYLVNSADLKPKGRMVKCIKCDNTWFQEPIPAEDIVKKSNSDQPNLLNERKEDYKKEEIKNLPSTYIQHKDPSILNSFIVIFLLIIVIISFWLVNRYGISIFSFFYFYLEEFYFNLNLIIKDFATLVYNIIN